MNITDERQDLSDPPFVIASEFCPHCCTIDLIEDQVHSISYKIIDHCDWFALEFFKFPFYYHERDQIGFTFTWKSIENHELINHSYLIFDSWLLFTFDGDNLWAAVECNKILVEQEQYHTQVLIQVVSNKFSPFPSIKIVLFCNRLIWKSDYEPSWMRTNRDRLLSLIKTLLHCQSL